MGSKSSKSATGTANNQDPSGLQHGSDGNTKYYCRARSGLGFARKDTKGSAKAKTQLGDIVQNQQLQHYSKVKNSPALVKKTEDQRRQQTDRESPKPQSNKISEEKTERATKDMRKPNSKDHSERFSNGKETAFEYDYIKWEGFDESKAQSGQTCYLCELDLAAAPINLEAYEDLEFDGSFSNIPPEVALHPYGHSCHAKCLQFVKTHT